MPFTFSHIAAVLPLLRHRAARWSATGLIAGSLAPDFEKFLRLGPHNSYSHSWASLLYFSCPMALGLAFGFHGVVRNPLLAHLPQGLHRRLAHYQHFAWSRYFRQHAGRVLLSVLLGAATHLVWDSFTHRRGALVAHWPALRAVWHVGRLYAPAFVFINALSSVLGAGLVLSALLRLPALAAPRPPVSARLLYWLLAGVVALGLVGGRLLLAEQALKNIDVIITVVAGGLAGVGAASAFFHLLGTGAGAVPVPAPARR
jgi:hypothetical protein